MKTTPSLAPHPAHLPLGTVVGPWRVVAWAGQGVYGAVYRAVRVGQEQAEPVALKVALLPRDPRFTREVALLSRHRHPSIPRLVDAGEWQHPVGTWHPYIAMEWIDGVPLYDWTREHTPDSSRVLRLLAQLAGALQALHAKGDIHRDLKGDNVLVRRADGRAVLMDFGSGIYAGAPSLTPQPVPPSTPAYRAPEAWLFELRLLREPTARYRATAADDLFALGVTACRLLTGEYPDFSEPTQDEAGNWQVEAVIPPASLLSDARVEPRLRALILRLLSVRPEERGTAEELVTALEQAMEPRLAESTRTAKPAGQGGRERARSQDSAEPRRPRAQAYRWRLRLATAAASATLMVSVWWHASSQPGEGCAARAEAERTDQPDAGTVGLGDTAAPTSAEDTPEPPSPQAMARDTLPAPQPGQVRPDAKGRCPLKRQVALNGGCWMSAPWNGEECAISGGYMYQGTCYLPSISPPGPRPTSDPADKP